MFGSFPPKSPQLLVEVDFWTVAEVVESRSRQRTVIIVIGAHPAALPHAGVLVDVQSEGDLRHDEVLTWSGDVVEFRLAGKSDGRRR